MELNDALQEMKNVATVPSLYPVQWGQGYRDREDNVSCPGGGGAGSGLLHPGAAQPRQHGHSGGRGGSPAGRRDPCIGDHSTVSCSEQPSLVSL